MSYFDQSAIRSFFYDVRVSQVVEDIKEGKCSFTKEYFARRTGVQHTQFSLSEWELVGEYVLNLLKSPCRTPQWHAIFHILPYWNDYCLVMHQNEFRVKFERLMDWHELTGLLGEDLLTTSYLAHPDCPQSGTVQAFTWPNVLGHDEMEVNQVLEKGLADIHAHLKATADVFELTWLSLMNRITPQSGDLDKLCRLAEPTAVLHTRERFYDIKCLVQMAAILRLQIFRAMHAPAIDSTIIKNLRADLRGFDEVDYRMAKIKDVQAGIDVEKQRARTCYSNHRHMVLDYAIRGGVDESIYSVHAGERAWLYHFFYRYYRNDESILRIADYVYLYLIIKIRVRREFVQTNTLYGLKNFLTYEHRKSSYLNAFEELYPVYAVQSSLREGHPDALEARVTPGAFPPKEDFTHSLFNKAHSFPITDARLRFVVHVIKQGKDRVIARGKRYGRRDEYHKQLDKLWQFRRTSLPYPWVGLDAAGSELDCPPEVFGQLYRYARRKGMDGLTYHVGEDFTDLADGLRRIEEAVDFLELDKYSRLGHALALGLEAEDYYCDRNRNVIMDSQRLLDTLTWLVYKAREISIPTAPHLLTDLENRAILLFHEIGYSGEYDVRDYYLSQKLRSDGWGQENGCSEWAKSRYCQKVICKVAHASARANAWFVEYLTDEDIMKTGLVPARYVYPDGIAHLVSEIQSQMQQEIARNGITIECNPTSNVKIGPFNGYKQHPIFRFKPYKATGTGLPISVAICTDDKGIFCTSLPNEFSLIAHTLSKEVGKEKAVRYIDEVRDNGFLHRF